MTTALPLIETEQQQHLRQQRLLQRLRERIDSHNGRLPFDEFMQLALYEPELGYYSAAQAKFGQHGDFITAPEITPLFAGCLARWYAEVSTLMPDLSIYEIGAGSGRLCADVLQALQALDTLPREYVIVEISPALRRQQQEYLRTHVAALSQRVVWRDRLPLVCEGVIFANEVFDAMPVRRFVIDRAEVQEQYVALEGEELALIAASAYNDRLAERIQLITRQTGMPFEAGYHSEVNFAAETWLAEAAQRLRRGFMVLVDYGYPRAVYYHPQRRQGTLLCHYRHEVNSDPVQRVGLQDITAFVDWTALAEAALIQGLTIEGFTTQAHFLLDLGVLDMALETAGLDPAAQITMAGHIKRLTLPHEMGEAFKVLILSRDNYHPVPGFRFRNRKDELTVAIA